MKITKDITIEDLVESLPDSIGYLADEGIRCLRCGEPIWGTLEEAAREKGFDETKIQGFVTDLQAMADKAGK
jgi:methionine synthase II (cobalamin-independent)